jgi:hypothetical protein
VEESEPRSDPPPPPPPPCEPSGVRERARRLGLGRE